MPSAFVIMPFDPSLQPVYEGLIKDVLERAGYAVQRADNLLSQRNILQDIVEAIEEADLVVVDLTDNNANVFYELGIAHARMRPTILLTQSVEEVPFDLRSYRLIPYSTHFADIDKARTLLAEHATAAISGALAFGSPVADYLRHAQPASETSVAVAPEPDAGSLGFVDHSEALESGLHRMTKIMQDVTRLTEEIGHKTSEAAEAMTQSQTKQGGMVPYGHLRTIASRLSAALAGFTLELGARNEEYRTIAENIDGSFEFMVRYASLSEQPQPERDEWLDVLQTVKQQASDSLSSYEALAETMASTPPFEKSLIRATREASRQVRLMADNIRLTVASIDRALVAAGRL